MTVKVIDGFVVNPIESLKAEWLYSQGRGRQFRIGEQVELARYLSQVCPMTGEALENEDERKLRLILSKAQQHQRQLQEEISGKRFIPIEVENFWLIRILLIIQRDPIFRQPIHHRLADERVHQIEFNRQEVCINSLNAFIFVRASLQNVPCTLPPVRA